MIHYQCPKCGSAMSSPESLVGQQENCLKCGNVAIVPSERLASPMAPVTVAQPVGTPVPAAADAGIAPEKVLLNTRPAMFRNSPIGFVLCSLLVPVGIGALILLLWWLDCIGTRLTITDRRIILRKGILSKRINEVRHVDIRNVRVSQGLLQRLLDVGKLELSTAAQAGIELAVSGIPHPNAAADIVRHYQG